MAGLASMSTAGISIRETAAMPCTGVAWRPHARHIRRRVHVPGTDLRPHRADAPPLARQTRTSTRAAGSFRSGISRPRTSPRSSAPGRITRATSAAVAALIPADRSRAFRSVRYLPTASSTSPLPRASSSHSTVTLAVRSGATIRRQARRHDATSRIAASRSVRLRQNGARTVFSGTCDGRLIALDAATGAPREQFGASGAIDLRAGRRRAGWRGVCDDVAASDLP